MDKNTLLGLYQRLMNDQDYDQLSLKLKKANIFHIMGAENQELKHSNFLAWLLQPNESHKLGNTFLLRFLRDVCLTDEKGGITIMDIEQLDYSQVEIRREYKNIDILILFPKKSFCVVVENKIWTSDHENQLKKYKAIVEKEFATYRKQFVYLTPFGDEPNDKEAISEYSLYSYEKIADQIRLILTAYWDDLPDSVRHYVSDYSIILARNIMGNDTTNELAQSIYKTHKEFFDFIIENRPDDFDRFKSVLRTFVTDNADIFWKTEILKDTKYWFECSIPTLNGCLDTLSAKHFLYCGWFSGKLIIGLYVEFDTTDAHERFASLFLNWTWGARPTSTRKWMGYKLASFGNEDELALMDDDTLLDFIFSKTDEIREGIRLIQKTLSNAASGEIQ